MRVAEITNTKTNATLSGVTPKTPGMIDSGFYTKRGNNEVQLLFIRVCEKNIAYRVVLLGYGSVGVSSAAMNMAQVRKY